MKKNIFKGLTKHIIATLVVGVAFYFLGELLYPLLTEKVFSPLGIALYFLAFFVILGLVIIFLSLSKADFVDQGNKNNYFSDIKITCVILAVFFVLTGVLEFVYELGDKDIPEPTSYVFMIDNSGSMKGSEQQRKDAINAVMKEADIPYAVYFFTGDANLVQPMSEYDSSQKDWAIASDGGTDIINSIKTVVKDITDGTLSGAGTSPKILLVSDGASSSMGMSKVVKECVKNGISISTIGVENCSKHYMRKLAQKTGGVFVECSDTSILAKSLQEATASDYSRTLLSDRVMIRNNALFGVMRVAFLTFMGLIWSWMKMLLSYESNNDRSKIFRTSLLLCTIASVLMEVLICGLQIPEYIARFIFCVMWAVTIGTHYDIEKAKLDDAFWNTDAYGVIGSASGDGIHKGIEATEKGVTANKSISMTGSRKILFLMILSVAIRLQITPLLTTLLLTMLLKVMTGSPMRLLTMRLVMMVLVNKRTMTFSHRFKVSSYVD
ncbi:MAG: VWA domain-containing protein [Ruminococcus sp.]|nr:VWA domain-containing protein [Ruminococcus sp.]